MLKKIGFMGLVLGVCLGVATRTYSASDTISATVGTISSVAISAIADAVSDFSQGANSSVAAANITINNNDPDGFSITISGSGEFRLSTASSPYSDAEKVEYTYALSSGSGTLGTDQPSLPSGVDLSAGDTTLQFNTNVSEATVDKVYSFDVTTAQDTSLFRGTYQETVTVTIADL